MGVVVRRYIYRYPHNKYLIFPTPLVLAIILAAASLLLCSLKKFFLVFKNKNKKPKWRFFTSRGAHVNCAIMAMLYTHSIGNQPQNMMVVFKMRDSVPSPRYSPVCNVLRQLKTSLIPTYRVYRLCDSYNYGFPKLTF